MRVTFSCFQGQIKRWIFLKNIVVSAGLIYNDFDCNRQQTLIGNAYCLNIFRIWLTYRAGITFTTATSHLLFKMHPAHLRVKFFLKSQMIVRTLGRLPSSSSLLSSLPTWPSAFALAIPLSPLAFTVTIRAVNSGLLLEVSNFSISKELSGSPIWQDPETSDWGDFNRLSFEIELNTFQYRIYIYSINFILICLTVTETDQLTIITIITWTMRVRARYCATQSEA